MNWNKKIIVISLAVLAVGIFAVGAWRMVISNDKSHQPYIPPQENADGTIDYTLIAKPKKYAGGAWVLRIPKDVNVQLSENEGESSVIFSGGGSVGFRAIPNGHIEVNFDLSMTHLLTKDEFPLKGKKVKHISVYVNADLGWIAKDKLKRQETSASNCKNLNEVAPGITALEPQKKPDEKPNEECGLYFDDQGNTFGFAVRNQSGNFVTLVECSTATGDHVDANCNATVNFPWYRHANIYFSLDEVTPDKFRETFQKITDYFQQRTVRIGTIPADKVYTPDLVLEPN